MESTATVSGPIDKSLYTALNTFKFVQVMTASAFTWEIITTMPKEFRLYKRGFKWTYLLLSFSRYFALVSLSMDVAINVATDVTPEFCDRIRYLLVLLASLGQFVTIPLLFLRTYAIWGENKALLPLLFILWVTPMAFGIYACTTYFGVPNYKLIPLDIIGGCSVSANIQSDLIAVSPYIANLAVDSLILFLTIGRLIHLNGRTQTSIVRRLLIRDGILYYIVVVIINVINVIFFLTPGIPVGVLRAIFAAPASTAVPVMVGRLFFNLQNSFSSHNGEVINDSERSGGSAPHSRNRRNLTVCGSHGPMYPMQPLQVSYAIDTTVRVDDAESIGAHQPEGGASSDVKKRPAVDYI